jgi:putative PEP-CTERM system histidine kinase
MAVVSPFFHAAAAVACLVWAGLLLAFLRGPTARLAALACLAAAAWAGAVAAAPEAPLDGWPGLLDVARNLAALLLLLHLCRRELGGAAPGLVRPAAIVAGIAGLVALVSQVFGQAGALLLPSLGSPALLSRLVLALLLVVVAENLYRNVEDGRRWFVNLPCVAFATIGGFDLLLFTDAALSHLFSSAMLDARAALAAIAAPLVAVAAVRNRKAPPRGLTREAVFHGATLIVAGTFLVAAGSAAEALRHLAGAEAGPSLRASILAGVVMVLLVGIATRSVRSRIRRGVVDLVFVGRYDYRREWLRAVAALSAAGDAAPARVRAVRTIADAVDSPGGALLLRDGPDGSFAWAESWNMPAPSAALRGAQGLAAALRDGADVAEFGPDSPPPAAELRAAFGPVWLAVPLPHHDGALLGAVLLAPPRAPFPLDEEVRELLGTLGRQVALFLAEREAAERLADARRLHEHARRFAFVSHDVKTVAAQLRLVLANAEANISDPEFQRDMLATVRAAADRIDTLIARLRQSDAPPEAPRRPAGVIAPAARLRTLAAGRAHALRIEEDADRPAGMAAISAESFDVAVTHLLDNAAEASGPGQPVLVRLRGGPERIEVDIIDQGPGMTAEYVRDELFRPLSTGKPRGTGIGAWQARELLREAGGEVIALSRPGEGTTMRLLLPAQGEAGATRLPAEAATP